MAGGNSRTVWEFPRQGLPFRVVWPERNVRLHDCSGTTGAEVCMQASNRISSALKRVRVGVGIAARRNTTYVVTGGSFSCSRLCLNGIWGATLCEHLVVAGNMSPSLSRSLHSSFVCPTFKLNTCPLIRTFVSPSSHADHSSRSFH